MKNFFLFLISLVIGIVLFIWITKTVGWEEIKKAFVAFTGRQGLIVLGLTIIMALIGNWKWKEILKGCGTNISFIKLFRPYLAGFSIMYLAPLMILGGEFFRAYILKEENSIPWSRGLASIIIDRILEWTANLLVVFFGLLFFLLTIGFPPLKLGIIFGAAFLVFTTAIFFFYFKSFKRESIIRFFIRRNKNQPLETEKEIFNFFKIKKIEMWKGFGLSFLRAAVMYIRAWILILFLGKTIGALPALSILGFSYLAVMIPIPAAIGSHEAAQVFAFNSLGLGAGAGTAFTMLIRAADLIIALAGIVILFRLGLGLIKKLLFKKAEKWAINNNNEI